MGQQGKKISEEEHEKIMQLLEEGKNPREISGTIRRSANAIYWHLKCRGVELSRTSRYHPPKIHDVAEEVDFSKMPDHILFNPKNFPSF